MKHTTIQDNEFARFTLSGKWPVTLTQEELHVFLAEINRKSRLSSLYMSCDGHLCQYGGSVGHKRGMELVKKFLELGFETIELLEQRTIRMRHTFTKE